MHTLAPPPESVLDAHTGAPRIGSFRGALPRVDLASVGRGRLWRFAHHKRWMYVAIASDEFYIGVAVVHLGYVASAFAFVFERTAMRLRVDRSSLGPPFVCSVTDTTGEGCAARYRLPGTSVLIERSPGTADYAVQVLMEDLNLHARLEGASAPPPLAAIASVPGGLLNATEKRALLRVTGGVTVCGRRHGLDGALAGFDYTQGLLARHTAWRWAFALGRARGGERVGLNLVEGFVGEPECAVWIDDELFPLGEGRFEFDRDRPLAPWRVRTVDDRVDLRFEPGGMHAERRSLGLIRSRFVQPVGLFHGRIAPAGQGELALERVVGVTEDQDMLW